MAGNLRHEHAMRELQRRKSMGGGRGASSSELFAHNSAYLPLKKKQKPVSAANQHIRDFAALKQGYQRRKEDFFKKLNTNPAAGAAGGKKPVAAAVQRGREKAPPSIAEVKKIRLGLVQRVLPEGLVVRRVAPQVSVGGTITRRIDGSPVRRPIRGLGLGGLEERGGNKSLLPPLAPPIRGRGAPTMFGGIRGRGAFQR